MNSPDTRSIVPVASQSPAHRAAATAPAQAPDALGLLKALRRRALLAAGIGLLASAAAAAAAFVLIPPAKYTARALLHVASEQPRILVKTGEAQVSYDSYQRTQLAILRSRLVLGAALRLPEVARLETVKQKVDPIEWLEKELQVEFANGSEMLRISMSGKDAHEPAAVVNAVVQAYLDEVVNVEVKQRRERADMLRAVWTRYQESLRSKRDEVRRLTMATGSDDKRAAAVLRLSEAERLAKADEELARTQGELRRIRLEYEILRKGEAEVEAQIPEATIAARVAADPEVAEAARAAELAWSRYEKLRGKIRDLVDPSISRSREEYAAARANLEAVRARARPAVAEQLRLEARGPASRAEPLRERIEVLAGLEAMLADDVKRLSERSKATTQASVDLTALNDEIAHADEMAKKIGAEVEVLSLELQAPPRIRLRERAEDPRTKDELRQAKASVVAALGAFAAAIFGVSFWEFRARRVDSPDDVRGLGLRVVGTLPVTPRGQPGARGANQQCAMIESVDAARAALVHAARRESIRVVMIGSAVGGEGKTSLACHLAASLARAGRATLLVDCDLRRPAAHRLFDVPPGPGVSEILRGEATLDEAIRPVAEGLWLLPAGRGDGGAVQALARDEFGALIARLRGGYDFVVVDSPPVLPVADALQVGQHSDAVIFSILRDVSQVPKVHAAYERLSSLGIRMLGAVVAGTPSALIGGHYYYGTPSREPA